ncbi:hypothetical protein Q5752_004281 [Cryptotrichosporon argae]
MCAQPMTLRAPASTLSSSPDSPLPRTPPTPAVLGSLSLAGPRKDSYGFGAPPPLASLPLALNVAGTSFSAFDSTDPWPTQTHEIVAEPGHLSPETWNESPDTSEEIPLVEALASGPDEAEALYAAREEAIEDEHVGAPITTGRSRKARLRDTFHRRFHRSKMVTDDSSSPAPSKVRMFWRSRSSSILSSASSAATSITLATGSSTPFNRGDATAERDRSWGKGRTTTRARARKFFPRSLSSPASAVLSPTIPMPLLEHDLTELVVTRCETESSHADVGAVEAAMIEPDPPRDLFGALPHELQLLVLKSVMRLWQDEDGDGIFQAERGGWRDMIRLSQVSREWQAICLDGQLWSLVRLSSFAKILPNSTIDRILASARPFISTLDLRHMDAIKTLVEPLKLTDAPGSVPSTVPGAYPLKGPYGPRTPMLPSLTTLDLRGCHRLAEEDIRLLIASAPRLETLCLRGLHVLTSAPLLRTLFECCQTLVSLDISYCRTEPASSDAVWMIMRGLSDAQAARLKHLRLGGMYLAHVPTQLVARFHALETLDMARATGLDANDMHSLVEAADRPIGASLRHLVLSGCKRFSHTDVARLGRAFPNLVNLELASLASTFRSSAGAATLTSIVADLPRLERLDLDGTGALRGVTDDLLEALCLLVDRAGTRRKIIELNIGFATNVTAEALVHLIRACPTLRRLYADMTAANDAVLREFVKRRREPDAVLSLLDCRALTGAAYTSLSSMTRPRAAFTGRAAVPFEYRVPSASALSTAASPRPAPGSPPAGDVADAGSTSTFGARLAWPKSYEDAHVPVVHSFHAWKRVDTPRQWRDALRKVEETESGVVGRPRVGRRRGSWWSDEVDDGACAIA